MRLAAKAVGIPARAAGLPSVRNIYLDFQATTPLDPRVLDAMMPYQTEGFGNPHSRSHMYGWNAEKAAERAREQVADLVGAHPKEIVFTSGATESNNLAVKGVAEYFGKDRNHLVTLGTEHKCLLESARWLELNAGYEVTHVPVDADGLVSPAAVAAAIRPGRTALVSVMLVHNEIGVLQPLAEIAAACRAAGVWCHTDAAQAVGKVPVDVRKLGVDLMSISGHKVYGPKGVGALYVRRKPRVRVKAIISGGGQERGMRSGTLPVPLVVGLGEACAVAKRDAAADARHVAKLSEALWAGLQEKVPAIRLNGSATKRYCGNLNVSFECVEGEALLMAMGSRVAVSSGSACTSASLEPSYVLRALGVPDELTHTSLRFGLGRFTTMAEVDRVVAVLADVVGRLRELSPLWEMMQEGIDLSQVQWVAH